MARTKCYNCDRQYREVFTQMFNRLKITLISISVKASNNPINSITVLKFSINQVLLFHTQRS